MTKVNLRCAIYTRKSSEEGLEQGFNSLDAQREACEAFITSQKQEGWKALPTLYDDGGYSGGNMDRPALKQLLADIDQKKIQVVVVYKVDRLTRSLADFAKIVEQFDAKGVSFVSVTQQFNTTSSMGRLTLNVLLSFAQFEREVTGERIRDKIAASKQKGMWMGGTPPLGYEGHQRSLIVHAEHALLVRHIYERYLVFGSVRRLKEELDNQSVCVPIRTHTSGKAYGGKSFSRGHLYRILTSPIYCGRMVHFDKSYPGQHPAIIEQDLWDAVQSMLQTNKQQFQNQPKAQDNNLLSGLLFDDDGNRMTPSHTTKNTKRYRYYLSNTLVNTLRASSPHGHRIPAQDLEDLVLAETISWLSNTSQLIDALEVGAEQMQDIIHQASECCHLLQQYETRQKALNELIHKIVVMNESIRILINPKVLGLDQPPIEFQIHTQLKRCGYAMRLMIRNGSQQPNIDKYLIAHLSKAQNWFKQLKTGKVSSIDEIAVQEELDRSHVVRTLHKAFLAPDIVKSILNGTQPQHLTLKWLKQFRALPIDWEEQRVLLGFKTAPARTANSAD